MITPAPFVETVIDCLGGTPTDRILDPACGTGTLLVAAFRSLMRDYDAAAQAGAASGARPTPDALYGIDLDERMCRLTTMHLLLTTRMPFTARPPAEVADSLSTRSTVNPSIIVYDPPFRSDAPQPGARQDFDAENPSNPGQLSAAHRLLARRRRTGRRLRT